MGQIQIQSGKIQEGEEIGREVGGRKSNRDRMGMGGISKHTQTNTQYTHIDILHMYDRWNTA
jgi:hypothetical protein